MEIFPDNWTLKKLKQYLEHEENALFFENHENTPGPYDKRADGLCA